MANVPVNEDKNHRDKDKSKHSTASYDDISRAVLWGNREKNPCISEYVITLSKLSLLSASSTTKARSLCKPESQEFPTTRDIF